MPSQSDARRKKLEREEERSEEEKGNERTRKDLLISHHLFSTPLPVIFLRAFHTHSPRLHIGQSNDPIYFYPIIFRAAFFPAPFIIFLCSSFSLSHAHAHARTQALQAHMLSFSLSFSLTQPSQLHFLALLELLAASLTVVVGFALQGGLLGLRVLTLLLLLLLLRGRVRRSRDGHLDRPSEIVYARR